MQFAITDIETTGRSNRITEIAIFIYDTEKLAVVDSYTSLVNPESPIPPFISALTGITNEMVEDAPRFYEIAKDIYEITENRVFVAHSVGFDYNVIRNEFKELGGEFNRQKLCTIRLSRKILPGHKSYGLGNLCKVLNIENNGRHRAWGDAEATVKLFEILLENDVENHMGYSLNRMNREATIPPNLSKDLIDNLPEATGVYYFHDKEGKILYVGKAKNIRSRINGHLVDHTSKKLRMLNKAHDITYVETGTELLALLVESHDIRHYFPEFNRAQKYSTNGYVLCKYVGTDGILRLEYAKKQKYTREYLSFFSNSIKAREFLYNLCEEYELCPRFCGLQSSNRACFNHQIGKCRGVCCGEESVIGYNERVQKALKSFSLETGSYLLIEKGRNKEEKAILLIRNGEYKGYAFLDADHQLTSIDDLEDVLIPQKHNSDIQSILVSHMNKGRTSDIIQLNSALAR